MFQVVKIIIVIFLVELECIKVNTLPKPINDLSVTFKKSNIKESVVSYFMSNDSFRCHSEIMWRCFNLKMWKKRKRFTISNLTESLLKLRFKRAPADFNTEYMLGGDTDIITAKPDNILVESFKRQWPLHIWRQYGLFTDDFIQHINPHWLTFPPPDPSQYYTLGGIYILMAVVGSIGNSIVILMYFR